jgi:tartrate-resistant acid phosphatase type 5
MLTYNMLLLFLYLFRSLFSKRYILAGNHDYCGNITKQFEYAQRDSTLWVYPDSNYNIIREFKAKKHGRKVMVEILMIDTQWIAGYFDCNRKDQEYPDNIKPDLQSKALSYIEEKLKNSSADYLLVAGHYPIFSACSNGNTKVLIDKLDPLLKKYDVSAYLSGHEHCQFHYSYENMEYITTGNGKSCCYVSEEKKNLPLGGKLQYLLADDSNHPGTFFGVKGGFASFDVGEDDMMIRMHIETGETFHETKLPPRKKKEDFLGAEMIERRLRA